MADTPCCRRAWVPLLVATILGAFYLVSAMINANWFRPRDPVTIAVDAEGKVVASPDIAVLTFGVGTKRQSTAQDAMAVLKKRMAAIAEALKAQSINAKDISTDSLSLNPAYDYVNGKQIPQGYEANQTLSVKVRNLEKVGDVLNVAVTQGANQVGGVAFTIDDPKELRAKARALAIELAKKKADMLASQLGKNLGKLTGFQENIGNTVYPLVRQMNTAYSPMGKTAEESIPVPAGQQDVIVDVTLTYEIR